MEGRLIHHSRFKAMLGWQEVANHNSRTQPISCYVDPCSRFHRHGTPRVELDPERPFDARLISIGRLLEWVYGYTQRSPGTRRAPSAGALFPTEIYVFGLEDGAPRGFYYSFKTHGYYRLNDADSGGMLDHAAAQRGDVVVVLGSVLWRTVQRYGVRGYRYCLLDAGVVAYNAHRAIAALGLSGGTEMFPPDLRMERMLALPYGEVCIAGLKLSASVVEGLADIPKPTLAEPSLRTDSAEMPPTLCPTLRRAASFHTRSLGARGGLR